MGRNGKLTHLLFVDDILIFCHCEGADARVLKDILKLFFDASIMIVNITKSTIYFPQLEANLRTEMLNTFNFLEGKFGGGV
jgi:hypothetical protein